MFGFKFLGNTHVPHFKNTAEMPAVVMTPPAEVLLPMSQHIGAPATPVVKVGDEVKVGQLIAEASGYVSSPIYSSVSGKVTKIDSYLRPDGRTVPAIRIASDGLMTVAEDIAPPVITDIESLAAAVRASGIVGLGGAGFPTSVKIDAVKKGAINTVILNGAECEPYITCDTRTMLDKADSIKSGIDLMKKHLPTVEKYIIGIENNKPQCIAKMKQTFEGYDDVTVATLPSLYPQGGEKVLIYNTTRRVVPEGKLPADVGVLVINVTSLAILADYMNTGMPLVSRVVTVDGSAVAYPQNVVAPIGASIRSILDFVGGTKCEIGKVLFGGPMMGSPACSLDEPITKTTGAITVMNVKDATEAEATPCIHCGRCVTACPLNLNPTLFSKALDLESKDDKIALLTKEKVMLCMECGCCSFVCPAKRPLVQNNRLGKMDLRAHLARESELKKAQENTVKKEN